MKRNRFAFGLLFAFLCCGVAWGADAVFWYRYTQGAEWQVDAPEGVLLSEPYYNWNKFLYIRKK